MVVVSSTLTQEPPQRDRRFWVTERHVLEGGEVREFYYLADAGSDVNQIMADRAAMLESE